MTHAPAVSCWLSPLCPVPTASALWARRPAGSWTFWRTPDRPIGRSCPWSPPATAIPPICPPPLLQAIPISSTWTSWCPWACSPIRRWRPPDGTPPTGWTMPISRPRGWTCSIRRSSAFPASGPRCRRSSTSHGWRTTPNSPPSSIRLIAANGRRRPSQTPSGWPSTPSFRTSSISSGST